jgi:hypothetical protein
LLLRFRLWHPASDSDKIVHRAASGGHTKLIAKHGGDLSVSPPPFAQAGDKVGVGLQPAARRLGVGFGEEICDLIVKAHARASASTIRHCPVSSGICPVIVRGFPVSSGAPKIQGPDGPGLDRTAFGFVRACPEAITQIVTYCVAKIKI